MCGTPRASVYHTQKTEIRGRRHEWGLVLAVMAASCLRSNIWACCECRCTVLVERLASSSTPSLLRRTWLPRCTVCPCSQQGYPKCPRKRHSCCPPHVLEGLASTFSRQRYQDLCYGCLLATYQCPTPQVNPEKMQTCKTERAPEHDESTSTTRTPIDSLILLNPSLFGLTCVAAAFL